MGDVSPVVKYSEVLKGGSVDRLDAEYHDPRRVAREIKLRGLGGAALATKASPTETRIPDPRKDAKPGEAFTYVEISGIDTRDGFVAPEIVEAVDAPSRARLKLTRGVVAMSSVRPARNQVFLTSDDLVGAVGTTGLIMLKTKDTKAISPELLFASLKSAHVVDQLDRRARASMYPTLAPTDVGNVMLAKLPRKVVTEVQDAISEALKERAAFLKAVSERDTLERALFDSLGPEQLVSELQSGSPTTRNWSELARNAAIARLDAEFYAKAYDAAIERMETAGPVETLGGLLTAADTGASPGEDEFQLTDSPGSSAVLKVGTLTGIGIQWSAIEYAPGKYSEKASARVEDGDIVFNSTAHQPKYMAHKVDVVRSVPAGVDGRLTFVAEMIRLRLRPSASVSPEYLAAFLRNPLGREQIRRCIRGISSHVYSQDVEGIVVPVSTGKDAQAIGDVIRRLEDARWKYSTLVRAAVGAIDSYVDKALA